jgi:chloramphenicol O-acetyltransferase type A
MDYPQYNLCMNVVVTDFLEFTKKNGLPFYYSMIFAATEAANRVENFRYRIRDGKVVLHDSVHPSFTDMDKTDDLFKFVTLEFDSNIATFCKKAKEKSEKQVNPFDMTGFEGRDDLLYITSIPWISFTHISHTISINRNDSVPRISWGKYFGQNGKIFIPFSVQVHHALVDGYHVGKYVEALQEILYEQK